jgi:hypothetical protein
MGGAIPRHVRTELLHRDWSAEGAAGFAGGPQGAGVHLSGEIFERVPRRVDPDEREFALDDGEAGSPDIGQDLFRRCSHVDLSPGVDDLDAGTIEVRHVTRC